MVLRMKNFNILEVHWKIRLLGEGEGARKTSIEGWIDWKEGAWTTCWWGGGGGVGKKGGGGVDIPMHTMILWFRTFDMAKFG